jgi:S1-C subfamily serine protease
MNKLIIALLILLLATLGGLGYYSYGLNQQVNLLSEQLNAFQTEQAAQVDELGEDLADFRAQALSGLSSLEVDIEQNMDRIDAVSGELEDSQVSINQLRQGLAETADDVEELATSGVTRSVLNAEYLYNTAGNAVVRISDGGRTIGSGFIYDGEARVVTAYHVVDVLDDIFVILSDGRAYPAVIVGQSEFSDVAVLELQSNPGLEPPVLADSSTVSVGQPVAAIGSPFDLPNSLTTGIVSQVDRFAEIEYNSQVRWVANLIQFDAAVNFGNSGCPLFNANGEIIGLVIARVQPDEGDGIYYAVSSNKVKKVADSLIENGSFDYPWLGVDITDLTPLSIQDTALDSVNGVLVSRVFVNSPADEAGLEDGDVIISFDGVRMDSTAGLTSYFGEFTSPGDIATLTIIREGDELEITLEVGARS